MRVIFPDKRNTHPLLTRLLERLPFVILITTCLSPLASYILKKIFDVTGIIETLSLSASGIYKHKFWQLVSYPLVTADSLCTQHERCLEITQRLLVRNALDFIFLYKALHHIIRKLGSLSCFLLITLQTILTGVAVWLALKLLHSSQALFGPECLISCLMVVWIFLDPEQRLEFRPLPITISRKWAFATLLIFFLFIVLFTGAFALLFGSIVSMALGVLFCRIHNIPNPYQLSKIF